MLVTIVCFHRFSLVSSLWLVIEVRLHKQKVSSVFISDENPSLAICRIHWTTDGNTFWCRHENNWLLVRFRGPLVVYRQTFMRCFREVFDVSSHHFSLFALSTNLSPRLP